MEFLDEEGSIKTMIRTNRERWSRNVLRRLPREIVDHTWTEWSAREGRR